MNVNNSALKTIDAAALTAQKNCAKANVNDVMSFAGKINLSQSAALSYAGKALDKFA
jgi:hypothetical protein